MVMSALFFSYSVFLKPLIPRSRFSSVSKDMSGNALNSSLDMAAAQPPQDEGVKVGGAR
jgi:hypothetical protein